jgi:hypothetical protein
MYGGEVASLTLQLLITLGEILGTHFCKRLNRLQGQSESGKIRSIEKFEPTTFWFAA